MRTPKTSAGLARAGKLSPALARAARRGDLERVSRGIYALKTPGQNDAFAELALRSEHAVVCLLSALMFHGITQERPYRLWVAMPKGHHSPKALSVTLETVTVSGAGYALGIQEHRISGVVTRIYSPAKTVVDCFKFRNRVGIAVAMLALKDSVAMRKATLGEIFEIAKQCRMANVMRPYLEGVQQ